jgi:hypothetical protein
MAVAIGSMDPEGHEDKDEVNPSLDARCRAGYTMRTGHTPRLPGLRAIS